MEKALFTKFRPSGHSYEGSKHIYHLVNQWRYHYDNSGFGCVCSTCWMGKPQEAGGGSEKYLKVCKAYAND